MLDILKRKQNDVEDLSGYLRAEEYMTLYDEVVNIIDTYEDLEDKHGEEKNNQVIKIVDLLIKTNTYVDVGDRNNLTLIRPSVRKSPETLIDGITFNFIPKYTNTEQATIQLGTTVRKPIKFNGEELLDNELKENMIHTAKYNKEKDIFELIFINPGKSDNIRRPKIITPEHFQPNFVGVIYSSEFEPVDKQFEGEHTGSNWLLATDPDFNNVIYKKENTKNGLTHCYANTTLGVGDHYVKVQYLSGGLKSSWSKVTKFTTPAIYVQTPVVEIEGGEVNVPEEAVFKTQPFAITGDSGSHLSTSWRVKDSVGEVIYSITKSDTKLYEFTLPERKLIADKSYTVECKYYGKKSNGDLIESEWGLTTFFTKKSYFRTPTLTGADEVNENTTTVLTIGNYRPYYEYEIVFDKENSVRTNNLLAWSVGTVNFDKVKTIGIRAKYNGEVSDIVQHTLIVKDVPVAEPILNGPDEAFENSTIKIKIANYNADYTYELPYTNPNCSLSGDTITWTLPEARVDSIGRVGVRASYMGDTTRITEYVILIKRVPLADAVITGPSTINEEQLWVGKINNYQSTVTYTVSASLGSLVFNRDNSGSIEIRMPDITSNKVCVITVSSRKGTETTENVTKNIDVISVAIGTDDTISIVNLDVSQGGGFVLYEENKYYGTTAIFAGGANSSNVYSDIEKLTIATNSNHSSYGDLVIPMREIAGCSDGIAGLFASSDNAINKIIIATDNNVTAFGNLSVKRDRLAACSDNATGLFAGGYTGTAYLKSIGKVIISSNGDTVNFGDLTKAVTDFAGCSDGTLGLFSGGIGTSSRKTVDKVTIATDGDATSHGNLTQNVFSLTSTSDSTIALFAGGLDNGGMTDVNKLTIATGGDAVISGKLTTWRKQLASCSDGTTGLFAGGYNDNILDVIEKLVFSTNSDTVDYGDLTNKRHELGACSGD